MLTKDTFTIPKLLPEALALMVALSVSVSQVQQVMIAKMVILLKSLGREYPPIVNSLSTNG